MKRFAAPLAAAVLAFLPGAPARADDAKDATAVIDKAVQAVGGAEKLGKLHAYQLKSKGKISFGGMESTVTGQSTVQDLDHVRVEFEGEFAGNKVQGVTVIRGGRGWRKMNGDVTPLDDDALRGEKRNVYIQVASVNPTVLKGNGFKLAKVADETIDGKPAAGVKATGPDGKDFTLYFDKASGLPVRVVATVMGFMGEEVTQESTYSDFKDFGGIKKSTKSVVKRGGEPFLTQELTDFKALDKVDPETFAEPK